MAKHRVGAMGRRMPHNLAGWAIKVNIAGEHATVAVRGQLADQAYDHWKGITR